MERSPEARLFRAYWQDGTLDLVTGGAVVLIGIGYLFEQFLIPVVVVPLAFAAWFVVRARVVQPRAGYVEFSRPRQRRSARWSLGAVALGIGLLALLVVLALRVEDFLPMSGVAVVPGDGGPAVDAVPALIVALAGLAAAWLTGAWRFAAYAGVITVAAVVAVLVGTGPALPVIVGGLVVWATGAVLFGRFMLESRRPTAVE